MNVPVVNRGYYCSRREVDVLAMSPLEALHETGVLPEHPVIQRKGLLALKLLHPPTTREQLSRRNKLMTEAVQLLKQLSTTPTAPSNTAAAAAAALNGTAAVPVAGSCGKGLLHVLPATDKARAEAWRDLRSSMGRLTKHLAIEVRLVCLCLVCFNSPHWAPFVPHLVM